MSTMKILVLCVSVALLCNSASATLTPYADGQANTGLLLHLDESSGTVAANTGGAGAGNGTMAAGASHPVSGVAAGFGNALGFSGSQSVMVPDHLSLRKADTGDGFTAEMWVKPTSLGSYQYLLNKYDGAHGYPGGRQYSMAITADGKLNWFALRSDGVPVETISGSWNGITGSTVLQNNQWYHAAATYNSGDGQWELWLNDQIEATFSAGAWGFASGASDLYLGSYNDSQNFFVGQMDEVRIGEYTYIPEPATMALLAIGSLLLRRKS